MSDFKAAFRAAKEAKSGVQAAPTPAQIRAMKAAKLAQKAGGGTEPTKRTTPGPSASTGSGPAAAAPKLKPLAAGQALPADFFQAASAAPPPPARQEQQQQQQQEQQPRASAASAPGAQRAGATAPVPEGFFADKAADAKARGIKLPDAKDLEQEFQAFQRSIDAELQAAAADEAQEAEEELQARDEQEDFAQWVRIQRIEELRRKKRKAAAQTALSGSGPGGSGDGEGEGEAEGGEQQAGVLKASAQDEPDAPDADGITGEEDDAAAVTARMLGIASGAPKAVNKLGLQLPKRRRVADTLAELLGGEEAEGQSDASASGDDVEGPGLLNWRAKRV